MACCGADAQQVGELHDEALRLLLAVPVVNRLVGDERVVFPDRQPVAPPPATERPARQRFAGIPFPLSEMQQTAGRKLLLQALDQDSGQLALPGTEGGKVPFGAVHVVDGHERRFAAHREPHVAAGKLTVDVVAAGFDGLPLLLGVRLRHARRFVDPPHGHLVAELLFTFVHAHRSAARR